MQSTKVRDWAPHNFWVPVLAFLSYRRRRRRPYRQPLLLQTATAPPVPTPIPIALSTPIPVPAPSRAPTRAPSHAPTCAPSRAPTNVPIPALIPPEPTPAVPRTTPEGAAKPQLQIVGAAVGAVGALLVLCAGFSSSVGTARRRIGFSTKESTRVSTISFREMRRKTQESH